MPYEDADKAAHPASGARAGASWCMIQSMTSPQLLERRTITIPAATADAVTQRVGPRQFSAYAAEAIADRLRLDAVRDHLAEMEAANGPTDPAAVAEIMDWLAQ